MERSPTHYLTATVRIPIYAGDKLDRDSWDWFEFREPGITQSGEIATCVRKAETISFHLDEVK